MDELNLAAGDGKGCGNSTVESSRGTPNAAMSSASHELTYGRGHMMFLLTDLKDILLVLSDLCASSKALQSSGYLSVKHWSWPCRMLGQGIKCGCERQDATKFEYNRVCPSGYTYVIALKVFLKRPIPTSES
ncbi:predicted protein [Histoplasma capsulatum var. duboisii H88]|uniref:Predicted protein n=2 Tax=Ajellomyces capsulatus TaxID=5037 RepID=F0U988_AJEC8|nr:predicted protein [Histoplasma capsulatum H143]EGC41038.1 predicted protein [Histoplasma capsulatum var. duboisii H88]